MKLLFENRLIFKNPEQEYDKGRIDKFAEGMETGTYEDANQAKRVFGIQNDIINQLDKCDVISKEEREQMKKRVEDAQNKTISESELRRIQSEIQGKMSESRNLYGNYSRQIDLYIGSAFNQNEAKNLKNEFKENPIENKRRLLTEITGKISKLVELYNDLIKEDPSLGSEILSWKIDEREKRVNNITEYKARLNRDRQHFSKDTLRQYIVEFIKLDTTEKQQEWIDKYEEEAGKRRILTAKYKEFSQARQEKHPEFWEMPRTTKNGIKGKEDKLKEMEAELQSEIEEAMEKMPATTKAEKEFGLKELKKLAIKEQEARLTMLPEFMKSLEKIESQHKKLSEEMHDLLKEKKVKPNKKFSEKVWAEAKFEEKEQLLRDMEEDVIWLRKGIKLLDRELKAGTINEETYEIYLQSYINMDMVSKYVAYGSFMKNMEKRQKVLTDFERLGEKTKIKFKIKFHNAGKYEERKQIYEEALEYQETEDKKTAKNVDGKKENETKKEGKETINQVQLQALFEKAEILRQSGKLKETIGVYESILILDKDNISAMRRKQMVEKQLDDMENIEDDILLERQIMQEAASGDMRTERLHTTIAEELLEEQSSIEKIAKTTNSVDQQVHLHDDFDKDLDKALSRRSHNKKRLDRRGKIDDVIELDTELIGETNDKDKIQSYKENLRNKQGKDNLNVENIWLVNKKSGNEESAKTAEEKLEARKAELNEELAERAHKKLKSRKHNINASRDADELREKRQKEALKKTAGNVDLKVDLAA